MADKTLERLARRGRLSIGPAVEYRNGKRSEDVLPAPPVLEIGEVVGTHDPDKAVARVAAAQLADGVGAVLAVKAPFEITHPDQRVAREAARRRQTLFERRHAARGLQRILRRHQPPNFIQAEAFEGLEADMEMAFMGRIERAAEKTDAFKISHGKVRFKITARQGRVWPVPRTTYLKVVN